MALCKTTGLFKFGTLVGAKYAIDKAGQRYTHVAQRCAACRCLHVVPMLPAEVDAAQQSRQRAACTQGTEGWSYLQVAVIQHATEKALLLSLKAGPQPLGAVPGWYPRSVIADNEDYEVGDKDVEIAVRAWFLEKQEA